MAEITGMQAICRDETCDRCGWFETYADVDFSVSPPDVVRFGCRKCGWMQDAPKFEPDTVQKVPDS